MEQNILILSASQWSMADEDTGEVRKGTTVWYIYDREKAINPDGSCGDVPAKQTMDYDYIEEIRKHGGAPIKAVATFALRTRKNSPVLEIQSIKFNDESKK